MFCFIIFLILSWMCNHCSTMSPTQIHFYTQVSVLYSYLCSLSINGFCHFYVVFSGSILFYVFIFVFSFYYLDLFYLFHILMTLFYFFIFWRRISNFLCISGMVNWIIAIFFFLVLVRHRWVFNLSKLIFDMNEYMDDVIFVNQWQSITFGKYNI